MYPAIPKSVFGLTAALLQPEVKYPLKYRQAESHLNTGLVCPEWL